MNDESSGEPIKPAMYHRTPAIQSIRELITIIERRVSESDDPNLVDQCAALREEVTRLQREHKEPVADDDQEAGQ